MRFVWREVYNVYTLCAYLYRSNSLSVVRWLSTVFFSAFFIILFVVKLISIPFVLSRRDGRLIVCAIDARYRVIVLPVWILAALIISALKMYFVRFSLVIVVVCANAENGIEAIGQKKRKMSFDCRVWPHVGVWAISVYSWLIRTLAAEIAERHMSRELLSRQHL